MLQGNLCQSVISRTTGSVCDRPRSGAPPETDHNHDQNLRTSDLRHGLANTTQLQTRLPDVKGTRVSRQTVNNRHRPECLQWTQDHVTWKMQQWSPILFSDECRGKLHLLQTYMSL
uniref:Transposase Tc1-like domain-containing protein n=1 Tax=Oryzias latipes TaxID=8090 RepID=A0A3P9LTE3_ORYLA